MESLVGSEPQRLSFGPPSQVQASFIEKMKHCWFAGSNAPLRGYRYETGQRLGEGDSSEGGGGYQSVMIMSDGGGGALFEVQFHKYNDNTLVLTKNVSLPSDLLSRLKRDIQLWALAGPDCSS